MCLFYFHCTITFSIINKACMYRFIWKSKCVSMREKQRNRKRQYEIFHPLLNKSQSWVRVKPGVRSSACSPRWVAGMQVFGSSSTAHHLELEQGAGSDVEQPGLTQHGMLVTHTSSAWPCCPTALGLNASVLAGKRTKVAICSLERHLSLSYLLLFVGQRVGTVVFTVSGFLNNLQLSQGR